MLHWESLYRLVSLQTSLDHCHDACVATGGDGRKQPILLPRLVNLERKHGHVHGGEFSYASFVFSTRFLSFASGPSSLPPLPCSFLKFLPSRRSSKPKSFRRGQSTLLENNGGSGEALGKALVDKRRHLTCLDSSGKRAGMPWSVSRATGARAESPSPEARQRPARIKAESEGDFTEEQRKICTKFTYRCCLFLLLSPFRKEMICRSGQQQEEPSGNTSSTGLACLFVCQCGSWRETRARRANALRPFFGG